MSKLIELGVNADPTVVNATVSKTIVTHVVATVPSSGTYSGNSQYPPQSLDNVITQLLNATAQLADITQFEGVCSQTIIEGQAVRFNSLNQLELCSANNLTHLGSFVGLAKQSGNAGDTIKIYEDEHIQINTWNWLQNKPVFLGTDGLLTQVSTGLLYLQQVGFAITPQHIVIRISQPFIRL